MSRAISRLLPLLAAVLLPFAALAQTADYPSRSIRIAVPYAAGGIADLLARTVAQHLGPELGQTIVIENQAGAGGHLGGSAVAKAPPDGYTLVLATISHNAAASMYSNLNYNPEKDLKPVILVSESAGVLIVNASVPAKTVQEFIALAKSDAKSGAKSGKPMSYGSAGLGSALHMAAELFKSMAAVELTHVPYRGSAPAMTDLLSGNIQAVFENIPTSLQHIQSGRIRALGVTSLKRSPLLPDMPTISESGVPGYAAVPWYTISVASGVPDDIVLKLNKAINTVLMRPDMAARWAELGVTPLGGSPQDAEKRNAEETVRWTAVIKSAGIKAQ
jgi:tripartite-type tricarboxylate transporter receptor subunit TctC